MSRAAEIERLRETWVGRSVSVTRTWTHRKPKTWRGIVEHIERDPLSAETTLLFTSGEKVTLTVRTTIKETL